MEKKTGSKKLKAGKKNYFKMTPQAKRGKKSEPRRGEYTYTTLSKLLKEEKPRIYVYTVVYDASAPYYNDDIAKYVCTMKLIDASLHPTSKGGNEFMQATFFARTEKEMPKVTKIGSILRVHRGDTKTHEKSLQLNCDVSIKGAWVLWDPTETTEPLDKTGKQFTFTPNDVQRLKDIRKFGKEFFASTELPGMTLKEAEKKKPVDFDVVGQVLEVKKKGNDSIVRVCDAGKVVKFVLVGGLKDYVGPQEIIRVRSAHYEPDSHFKKVILKEHSSIIRVPKEYKAAKVALDDIHKTKDEHVKLQLALYTPKVKDLVEGTKIINTHKQTKAIALKDLFSGEAIKSGQQYYKVRASVIEVGPKKPEEWIAVYDHKTKKTHPITDVFPAGKKGAKELPKDMEYCYRLTLYMKDHSVVADTNLYTVFVSTCEGQPDKFLQLNLGRKAPTEEVYKELKKKYKMLTRSWVVCDLLLEYTQIAGGQPLFTLVDTTLQL